MRIAEVAGSFKRCGNKGIDVHWIIQSRLFKIDEEECLLLLDRASKRKTILIPSVIRIGDFKFVAKEFVRIHGGSLAEPPTAPVKFVFTFFQHNVYDSSSVVAILR